MSKWRQKGFVQDSDEEEEESQQESQKSKQNASLLGRVERVDGTTKFGGELSGGIGDKLRVKEVGKRQNAGPDSNQAIESGGSASPASRFLPRRPTASPLTPVAMYDSRRGPAEGPDPLQNSPSPKARRVRRNVSQLLGSPIVTESFAPPEPQQHDVVIAISSQILEDPSLELRVPISNNAVGAKAAPSILGAFGIELLSDASEDDALSDPPTDIDSPETGFTTPQPHRKTAVQVVIPSSTALQRHMFEQESRREFRQRKPIQLHPYALEGELYRREVQSRGLKPVPRPRSPERRTSHNDAETQEKEFDPNETPSSSPPEPEIPVSTPLIRRPRKDGPQGSSTRRRASDPARRQLPATQLHRPYAAKRRKLNLPRTQTAAASKSIFDDEVSRRDIWSIPPNSPPYSSSPPFNGIQSARRLGSLPTATPAPNLPTPSTSSIFQDDPQPLSDPDTDAIPRSTQQSSGELRRPTRITLSENSSCVSESASEAEQSDSDLRKVGKKIKGVLPASWLRFDRQAQNRREVQARERQRARLNAIQSPEPSEPQRGVAKRVMKRAGGGGRASTSTTPAKDVVAIFDGSDNEPNVPFRNQARDMQDSVEDATALAAAFDCRYAEGDSDNMENDRLHLFTLGGAGSKRKKQTKLTDAFGKAKRLKSSNGTARTSQLGSFEKPHARAMRAHQTPPLALSVVDLDLSPSKQDRSIPQFIRVARRQALRRSDLARQSPQTKHIQLHHARDTEDASRTLQQWRQGVLKPKTNVASQRRKVGRSPLVDRAGNQQHAQQPTQVEWGQPKDFDTVLEAKGQMRSMGRPVALELFQRTFTQRMTSSHRSKKPPKLNRILERSIRRGPLPFRTGQLEGDENDFGRGHRKIAFEKGLRRADHQPLALASNIHSYMNPQLARFLADEDAVLPPLPSAKDIGEFQAQNGTKEPLPPKRRLLRKKTQALRIDVEAREYRQPSEPALQEILNVSVPEHHKDETAGRDQTILWGLGPYGTHYPTTFDVNYLQSETYFHSSTFVGSEDLRRALSIGQKNSRDLDESAGYCTITSDATNVRCGPWNDETSSGLYDIVGAIIAQFDIELAHPEDETRAARCSESWKRLACFLRTLIQYVSTHLSFSDPVDRRDFVVKIHQLLFSLFYQVSVVHATSGNTRPALDEAHHSIQVTTLLLVLGVQTFRIAQHDVVDSSIQSELLDLMRSVAKAIVTEIVRKGILNLSNFLEQNRRHAARQNGIQEDDVLVEGVVVCIHALESIDSPGSGFWDFVSQELSPAVTSATRIQDFESAWAIHFTLVPFFEIDVSGIPSKDRRECFRSDDWHCIITMLRRLFELYPGTYKKQSSSLNEYVRANLARCHRLIKHWHWHRPEQMLNTLFDFFGKNGLKQLRRESGSGSVSFLDTATVEQTLTLGPNECSFHIALKCLVLGLRGMKKTYTDKKIRSFVFRTIPNHGRSYPKDQPLDEESLAALRNHHDLLCTLYWAAPPSYRPKLGLIRGLVSHETSHREACRVNVRAWANLTTFQLSTDEPYLSAKPFALWHKEIMHQTLKQYRLARTEADDYLKSGVLDGTTDVSAVMVRQTMERNQEQVIATLRDCIAGMRKAMQSAKEQTYLDTFLIDSGIVHLLELPHLEDRRLVNVIRDTLALLQEHAKLQKALISRKASQQKSEESQDYGDFPDLDDLDSVEPERTKGAPKQSSLDCIQTPLWHLLSNAFGTEVSPDDNILMDCVETWVLVADVAVTSRTRSWSYYIDTFSQVSWQQLRHTEQTRKFGPYFLAVLIDCDPAAYEEHRLEFITALLLSLVDRESMLRFQHRLLHAIARIDQDHPLMNNLPFIWSQESGHWDITADTVRSRRLAVISSILSNMRDNLHNTASATPERTSEVKRTYATMLKDFMTKMKNNYQQLQQGATVTGVYVDFVQKIVQFLKQYTGDICPVLPFFTDSVAFPLPSTDPTYVVGRLCGYAPKATNPGTAKQLSVFIQTVTQQAAADNQQTYLVKQLTTALCSDEAPAADRAALRSVLLQGIFPTYLERAFSSSVTLLIARPIFQSLRPILDTMIFDLRVNQPASVDVIVGSIVAVSHAFIRGNEHLKTNPTLFEQPHTLSALANMLEAMCSILPILDYICNRTTTSTYCSKLRLFAYIEQFSIYVAEMIHNMVPHTIPYYQDNAHATSSDSYASLLTFCKQGLDDSMKANWSEEDGAIRFGQGHAKREVALDIGSVEEEKARLVMAVETFHVVLRGMYEDEHGRAGSGCGIII